jgi:hypothetical protein
MASPERVRQIKEVVLPKYAGRIDLKTGKILKLQTDEPVQSFHKKAGYFTITVRIEGKPVSFFQHEVIAVASGLDIEGKTVNHVNELKTDNRPENLEAVTRGDNTRLHWVGRGRSRKLTEEQREEMKTLREQGMSYQSIGNEFGVSHSTVQRIVKGRSDRFNGWEQL